MAKSSETKTKSKTRSILEIVLYSVVGLATVTAIVVSITTIYHNNRYTKFWVNGQSMYPTLNKNAKYEDGTLIGERRIGGPNNTYDVDYGFMDTREETINQINRFDIIVCHLDNGGDTVIKRVIALPGETFYLSTSSINPDDNGNLFVKTSNGDNFTLIEQPIDSQIVHGGKYDYKPQYNDSINGYTLASNEYFVMGDNRYAGNSVDSRQFDKGVLRENIDGKVVGLEATCRISLDQETGKYTPVQIHYYIPRYI